MEKNLCDLLPIYGIEREGILSKKGDYTIGFRLRKPEIFTLSADQYESLHQAYVRGMRVLPPHTILHLQDWFLTDRYRADFNGEEKSFLARSSERFFHERPWLRQESYLFLTRRPKDRQESSSAFSSLLRGRFCCRPKRPIRE